MSRIYHNEGMRGFYKGFGTAALKGIPSNCIFFMCYEGFKKKIEDKIEETTSS